MQIFRFTWVGSSTNSAFKFFTLFIYSLGLRFQTELWWWVFLRLLEGWMNPVVYSVSGHFVPWSDRSKSDRSTVWSDRSKKSDRSTKTQIVPVINRKKNILHQ